MKLNNISMTTVTSSIIKYGAQIFTVIAIGVITYLSFVETLNLNVTENPESFALVAITATILNFMLWNVFYKKTYSEILVKDIDNKKYCIHERYYLARQKLTDKDTQEMLNNKKQEFIDNWLRDVQDITGNTIEEILASGYKGKSHKWLRYRVKHRMYPRYGIKTVTQLRTCLNVGTSNSLNVKVNRDKVFYRVNAIQKLVLLTATLGFTCAIVPDFTDGNIASALFKLCVYIAAFIISILFGSINGDKGGNMKLETAEQVAEMMEQYSKTAVTYNPYKKDIEPSKEQIKEVVMEALQENG